MNPFDVGQHLFVNLFNKEKPNISSFYYWETYYWENFLLGFGFLATIVLICGTAFILGHHWTVGEEKRKEELRKRTIHAVIAKAIIANDKSDIGQSRISFRHGERSYASICSRNELLDIDSFSDANYSDTGSTAVTQFAIPSQKLRAIAPDAAPLFFEGLAFKEETFVQTGELQRFDRELVLPAADGTPRPTTSSQQALILKKATNDPNYPIFATTLAETFTESNGEKHHKPVSINLPTRGTKTKKFSESSKSYKSVAAQKTFIISRNSQQKEQKQPLQTFGNSFNSKPKKTLSARKPVKDKELPTKTYQTSFSARGRLSTDRCKEKLEKKSSQLEQEPMNRDSEEQEYEIFDEMVEDNEISTPSGVRESSEKFPEKKTQAHGIPDKSRSTTPEYKDKYTNLRDKLFPMSRIPRAVSMTPKKPNDFRKPNKSKTGDFHKACREKDSACDRKSAVAKRLEKAFANKSFIQGTKRLRGKTSLNLKTYRDKTGDKPHPQTSRDSHATRVFEHAFQHTSNDFSDYKTVPQTADNGGGASKRDIPLFEQIFEQILHLNVPDDDFKEKRASESDNTKVLPPDNSNITSEEFNNFESSTKDSPKKCLKTNSKESNEISTSVLHLKLQSVDKAKLRSASIYVKNIMRNVNSKIPVHIKRYQTLSSTRNTSLKGNCSDDPSATLPTRSVKPTIPIYIGHKLEGQSSFVSTDLYERHPISKLHSILQKNSLKPSFSNPERFTHQTNEDELNLDSDNCLLKESKSLHGWSTSRLPVHIKTFRMKTKSLDF